MGRLTKALGSGGGDKKGSAQGAYPPILSPSTPPMPVTGSDMSFAVTLSPAFVLRGLPGVAGIEARLERASRHPNPLWAPEMEGLEDDVDNLSRRLFGITRADVLDEFDITGPADPSEAPDWDVTDGRGRVLRCWDYLGEQIVCVSRGDMGRTPDARSDEEIEREARLWGLALTNGGRGQ